MSGMFRPLPCVEGYGCKVACFYPLPAWQTVDGTILFAASPKAARELKLPCGQCVGCRLERSRQWAVRCYHEAQMHDSNLFVTLTYSDAHLPHGGNLHYPDFQLFMRKLRKQYGKVRFYMCGEYGEEKLRPHYHACLFGLSLPDAKYFAKSPAGHPIYTSASLSKLWPWGHANFGRVSFESAAYVARYIMKKVTGPNAAEHYQRLIPATGEIVQVVPEFTRMSLKPGIGATWMQKYRSDVYTRDGVVIKGQVMKPPRYYDNFLKEVDSERFESLEYERFVKSQDYLDDNAPERLPVREAVVKAALNFKKRVVE